MLQKRCVLQVYSAITCLLFLLIALNVWGCSSASSSTGGTSSESTATSASQNTPVTAITTSQNITRTSTATAGSDTTTTYSNEWNAIALAFEDTAKTNQWFVANSNYLDGHTTILTQQATSVTIISLLHPMGMPLSYKQHMLMAPVNFGLMIWLQTSSLSCVQRQVVLLLPSC